MSNGVLLVLGSINVDFQVRTERWPEQGETLLGQDFRLLGGGKAANRAYIAHRLGAQARLIGHVGDDPLADCALGPLSDLGVDLQGVRRQAGQPTGVSMITVRPDGQKTIVLAANANEVWMDEDAESVAKIVADAPDGSLLSADLEVPPRVVRRAVDAAKQRGFPVILDPSPASRVPDELQGFAGYLTPNTSEAGELTGIEVDSPEAAAKAGRALVERGVPHVYIKLSHGGCVVVTGEGTEVIHSVPIEIVDATGAGDGFAGALGVALLEGQAPVEAVRFGVAASALTVMTYGSQPAYPDREKLNEMLARLRRESA